MNPTKRIENYIQKIISEGNQKLHFPVCIQYITSKQIFTPPLRSVRRVNWSLGEMINT